MEDFHIYSRKAGTDFTLNPPGIHSIQLHVQLLTIRKNSSPTYKCMYTSLYAHFWHTCLAMVVAKCSLLALSNPTRVVYTSPTRSCSTSPDAFIPYKDVDINFCRYSLVPRTSPASVFDENFFAYCKQSKTGAREGLETRLVQICSSLKNLLRIPSTKLTNT